MQFNAHPEVAGSHAFLSASKYSWIRYDEEKIIETFTNAMAAARGTRLHAFAAEAIALGQRLTKTQQTLNMYVNDAISMRMKPEVLLFYTRNAFGTADAISFRRERGHDKTVLRIHDLKTGTTKSNVNQLEIYAAFFCLEYDMPPHTIDIELRIYQNDFVQIYIPDPEDILHIMDKLITFDRIIDQARQEALA